MIEFYSKRKKFSYLLIFCLTLNAIGLITSSLINHPNSRVAEVCEACILEQSQRIENQFSKGSNQSLSFEGQQDHTRQLQEYINFTSESHPNLPTRNNSDPTSGIYALVMDDFNNDGIPDVVAGA